MITSIKIRVDSFSYFKVLLLIKRFARDADKDSSRL
jgi:hypothetical protein